MYREVMDSRQVGHAQRRRIGAPSNVYDDADFGPEDYEDQANFQDTMAARKDPAQAAANAKARLAEVRKAVLG